MTYYPGELAILFVIVLMIGGTLGYLAGYDHAESVARRARNAERRHKHQHPTKKETHPQ